MKTGHWLMATTRKTIYIPTEVPVPQEKKKKKKKKMYYPTLKDKCLETSVFREFKLWEGGNTEIGKEF